MRVLIAEDSLLLRAGPAAAARRPRLRGRGRRAGRRGAAGGRRGAPPGRLRRSTSACRRRTPTRACAPRWSSASAIRTWPSSCSRRSSRSATPPRLLQRDARGVGYLLKDRVADVSTFVERLREVAAGGTAIDPEVVAQLLGRRRGDRLSGLTPRELEVLGLMAEGRSNVAIATALGVGEGAVEKHVKNVFAKLELPPVARRPPPRAGGARVPRRGRAGAGLAPATARPARRRTRPRRTARPAGRRRRRGAAPGLAGALRQRAAKRPARSTASGRQTACQAAPGDVRTCQTRRTAGPPPGASVPARRRPPPRRRDAGAQHGADADRRRRHARERRRRRDPSTATAATLATRGRTAIANAPRGPTIPRQAGVPPPKAWRSCTSTVRPATSAPVTRPRTTAIRRVRRRAAGRSSPSRRAGAARPASGRAARRHGRRARRVRPRRRAGRDRRTRTTAVAALAAVVVPPALGCGDAHPQALAHVVRRRDRAYRGRVRPRCRCTRRRCRRTAATGTPASGRRQSTRRASP